MESLVARGTVSVKQVALPDGTLAPIRELQVRFGRATPDRLPEGALAHTYTSKPLVSVGGDAMFGELAIVRWLERDGWEAVWVDHFHGRKFWRAMPHRSDPVALPPLARARYDAVVAANGGRARGFFDVLAWRGGQLAHLEYEGPGDRNHRDEAAWIAAAIRAGATAHELWFVRCGDPDDDGG